MMKRIVYRVQWAKTMQEWIVVRSKIIVCGHARQAAAIECAVTEARDDWQNRYPAQVVLHGKNGRIRWERTYGRDPRRSKG